MKSIFFAFVSLPFFTGCINACYDQDGVCSVHEKKMRKSIVRVHYGMSDISIIRNGKKYPNRKNPIEGGCVVGMKKLGIRYVCKSCNKEYRKEKRRR